MLPASRSATDAPSTSIEIDAASHGLVEDARDLVMRALTAPSELRRRVYIIDEVHMLSTHAFNALLKLVEEPPDHVVFILATTDTHKVPATIISRTQRFDFRRIAIDVIVGKLTRIVEAEGADADAAALALVARLADGGMRDAESLLDQVLVLRRRPRDGGDGARGGRPGRRRGGGRPHRRLRGRRDAPAALDHVAALADAGRDMAQVAAQAEGEARRRLLASAADPTRARRLATILRTVAEAAGVGAREGRARLLMELLAVEQGTPSAAQPATAPAAAPTQVARSAAPPRGRPPPLRRRARPARYRSGPPLQRRMHRWARPRPSRRAGTAMARCDPAGRRSSSAPARPSSRCSRNAGRWPATARA